MSEKKILEIRLQLDPEYVENLKAECRAQGFPGLSATDAVLRSLALFRRDAQAVKVLEPERREIENRSGSTVPVKTSKDVLRAFERVAGGPNAIVVDVDPAIESVMRDSALQLRFTYSEFAKMVLQEAYVSQFLETVETKGLYFSAREWDYLLKMTGRERIRSGEELLTILAELKAAASPVAAEA